MGGKLSILNEAMDEDFLFYFSSSFACTMRIANYQVTHMSFFHYIVSITKISPALAILSWVASFSLNISRKLHSLFSKTARAVFTLYMVDTISQLVINVQQANIP